MHLFPLWFLFIERLLFTFVVFLPFEILNILMQNLNFRGPGKASFQILSRSSIGNFGNRVKNISWLLEIVESMKRYLGFDGVSIVTEETSEIVETIEASCCATPYKDGCE